MTEQNPANNRKNPDRNEKRDLIIICAIIALILAALAIPALKKSMKKSMAGEVRKYLKEIYKSQNNFHDKKGRYAGHEAGKQCFELLGWEPESKNLYNYYCDTDVFPSKKGDHSSCPVPEVPPVTRDSFTIFAVANIDNDPACDVWSINDAGKIIVHFDDVKENGNPRTESPGPSSPPPKP